MASCSSGVKLRSSVPTKSRMEQLLQQAPDLTLGQAVADVVLALAGALVADLQMKVCVIARAPNASGGAGVADLGDGFSLIHTLARPHQHPAQVAVYGAPPDAAPHAVVNFEDPAAEVIENIGRRGL